MNQIYLFVNGTRVIGRGTSNAWTPRSPDLTECDFFVGSREHACVRHRAAQIQEMPGIFTVLCTSMYL